MNDNIKLKKIAKDVFEICSQGFDEDFHDNVKDMLSCDYNYLTEEEYRKIINDYIEELIKYDGFYKEEKEVLFMSYDSPSKSLDDKEICSYIKLTNELSVYDLIQKIWKDGFDWGYELGFEEGKDE